MNLDKIGMKLAYLLRHCRQPVYVSTDGGWASVDVVLEALRTKWPHMDRPTLDAVVAADRKGRFSYDPTGTLIRANQGHSIPGVVVEMTRPEPPEFLYHGTADRFVPSILRQGLRPMSRQFVHLSGDYATAVMVGSRHGRAVVLLIRAADFVRDGHELLLSANGVWQAKAVPPEYLSVCAGDAGNEMQA